MRQLDLKPSEYRKKNPRTGIWQVRDNPRLCFVMMLLAIAGIIWLSVWGGTWNTPEFWAPIALAFGAGGMFAYWLKDY